jgi:hypothetical protein
MIDPSLWSEKEHPPQSLTIVRVRNLVDSFLTRRIADVTFNDGIADVFDPAMDYDGGVTKVDDREPAQRSRWR